LKPRWIIGTALGIVLLGGSILFLAGALAAESALRPPRHTVASVCPCIAHVTCRDAQVNAPDGTRLSGWYFEPDAPIGGALLLMHGVGDTREGVVSLGSVFLRRGYAVLTPDLRGHGESGGLTTYGVREGQDVHAWADWMLQQPHIARIYGFGASLGGSELLEALDREPRFRAVIAESAYSSFPPSRMNEWAGRFRAGGNGLRCRLSTRECCGRGCVMESICARRRRSMRCAARRFRSC